MTLCLGNSKELGLRVCNVVCRMAPAHWVGRHTVAGASAGWLGTARARSEGPWSGRGDNNQFGSDVTVRIKWYPLHTTEDSIGDTECAEYCSYC
jgi:hypothetical protein